MAKTKIFHSAIKFEADARIHISIDLRHDFLCSITRKTAIITG